LSRGTIVNITSIQRVTSLPGGTYLLRLKNGQQHQVSRLRARVLRDQLLRL
jgi:DNA-binding LytR/AlgR family response regulator